MGGAYDAEQGRFWKELKVELLSNICAKNAWPWQPRLFTQYFLLNATRSGVTNSLY